MLRPLLRVVAATAAVLPLSAQAGNEILFVGSSQAGSTDPHAFVASAQGVIVDRGGLPETNNVTDAVWTDSGRRLYVSTNLAPKGISLADWDGSQATWSQWYSSMHACHGLGLDAERKRLWVFESSPASATAPAFGELTCLDADPQSPTYGLALAQTTGLSGPIRERWELSLSGNYAVVPHLLLQSGVFQIVDTNPSSPTFLQTVVTAVNWEATSQFNMVADCGITADDQYAIIVYTGVSPFTRLAAWNLPTGSWVDFDPITPGQQDLDIAGGGVATSLDLPISGNMAIVTGIGNNSFGGNGWCKRIDLDWSNPGNSTQTDYISGQGLPNCYAASVSPDETRFAVTSYPGLSTSGALSVFDIATGAELSRVTLSQQWNVYTTAWQDSSPLGRFEPFGAGCNGSAGVPGLAAAPGSRPRLGATFEQVVTNVPQGIALVSLGFSNTTSAGLPLPLPLDVIGMTGCTLFVEQWTSAATFAPTGTGLVQWPIPNDGALFGLPVYTQGFPLDTAANPFGWTASNAGLAVLGY